MSFNNQKTLNHFSTKKQIKNLKNKNQIKNQKNKNQIKNLKKENNNKNINNLYPSHRDQTKFRTRNPPVVPFSEILEHLDSIPNLHASQESALDNDSFTTILSLLNGVSPQDKINIDVLSKVCSQLHDEINVSPVPIYPKLPSAYLYPEVDWTEEADAPLIILPQMFSSFVKSNLNSSVQEAKTVLEEATTHAAETFDKKFEEKFSKVQSYTENIASRVQSVLSAIMDIFRKTNSYIPDQLKTISILMLAAITIWFSDFDPKVIAAQVGILAIIFLPEIISEMMPSLASSVTELLLNLYHYLSDKKHDLEERLKKNEPENKDIPLTDLNMKDEDEIVEEKEYTSIVPHGGIDLYEILLNFLTSFKEAVGATFSLSSFFSKAKVLGDFSRNALSIKTFYLFLKELIEFFLDFGYEILGIDRKGEQLAVLLPGFLQYTQDVSTYTSALVQERFKTDTNICKNVELLYMQSLIYLKECSQPNKLLSDRLCVYVRQLHQIVCQIYAKSLTVSPIKQPTRDVPLMTMIAGPPGCGKTKFNKSLAAWIGQSYYPDIAPNALTYSRTNGTPYWDGYSKLTNKITFLDDVFQSVDSVGSANQDFLDIIRAVNTAQFLLPVAVCELKAENFFLSDHILATTNADVINAVSITEIGAVIRRISVDAIMIPICPAAKPFTSGIWTNWNTLHKDVSAHCKDHGMDCYAFLIHDKDNDVRHRNFLKPKDPQFKNGNPKFGIIAAQYSQFAFTSGQFLEFWVQTKNDLKRTEVDSDKLTKQMLSMKIQGQMYAGGSESYEQTLNNANIDHAHFSFSQNTQHLNDTYFFSENLVFDVADFVLMNQKFFTEPMIQYCEYIMAHVHPNFNILSNHPVPSIKDLPLNQLVKFGIISMVPLGTTFGSSTHDDVFDSLWGDFLAYTQQMNAQMEVDLSKVKERQAYIDKARSQKKEDDDNDSDEDKTEEDLAYEILDQYLTYPFEYRKMVQRFPLLSRVPKEYGLFRAHWETMNAINSGYLDLDDYKISVEDHLQLVNDCHNLRKLINSPSTTLVNNFIARVSKITELAASAMRDYTQSCIDTFKAHPKAFLVTAGSVLLASFGLYYTYFSTGFHVAHSPSDSEEEEGEKKQRKRDKKFEQNLSKFHPAQAKFVKDVYHTGHVSTSPTVIQNMVYANLCFVRVYNGDRSLGKVHGFFVASTSFITVAHLKLYMDQCTHITLQFNTQKTPYRVDKKKFTIKTPDPKEFGELDIMCVTITAESFNKKASILRHLPNSTIINKGFQTNANLALMTVDPETFPAKLLVQVHAILHASPIKYQYETDSSITTTNTRTLRYAANTCVGNCGGILYSLDDHLPQKIIGMHIAGDKEGTIGFSVVLNIELIQHLLPLNGQADIEIIEHPAVVNDLSTDDYFGPGNYTPLGRVPDKMGLATRFKSKLIKSPLFETYGPATKAPAALSPTVVDGIKINPLKEALRRATNQTPQLNDSIVNTIMEDLKGLHKRKESSVHPRVLTDHESIYGIPECKFFDSMALDKSPGWPDNLKYTKKHHLINPETKLFITEVMERIKNLEDLAKKGILLPQLFSAFLKDEKLKLAKVLIAKSRAVYCAPLALLHLVRKYFLSFTANTMMDRIYNGLAVGIDPCSPEWDELVRHLNSKGSHVFAGDFGEFDLRQNYQITSRIVEIINDWYDDGEENRRVRRVLWLAITQPVILFGTRVYMLDHTIPSGHPLTAVANSIYVQAVFRYVWIKMFKNTPDFKTLYMYNKNVAQIVYGDDNVNNVSDLVRGIFNQNTVPEYMNKMGMVYTNEDKSELHIPDTRPITEVTFLKRKFKYDPELRSYQAPLEINSIDESIYYTTKIREDPEMVANLLYENFHEYGRHGREIYTEKKTAFTKAVYLRNLHISYHPPLYEDIQLYLLDKAHPFTGQALICQMSGKKEKSEKKEKTGKESEKRTSTYGRKASHPNSSTSNTPSKMVSKADKPITKFKEDTGSVKVAKPHITPLPWFTNVCKAELSHPVTRMMRIATVTWNIGTPVLTQLYTCDFPEVLLDIPMIKSKVEDFRFLRANIKVKILINCPPTSIGKCWCYFNPMATKLGNRAPEQTLACLTGYDGFVVSAGTPSTTEFEIPYCAPNNYHDLKNELGSLGSFNIVVMNPFNSLVLTDTASLQIYAWFDDVSLCVPTPNTIIAQMDEGEEKSKDGVISGIATRVKVISDYVAPVPFLGTFSSSISWIADAVANVASSFGFSKPTSIESAPYMSMLPGARFTHGTGLDNSISLSCSPDNQILPTLHQFATDVDEMDIRYVCGRKCYLTTALWSVNDAQGTILLKLPVTPALSSDPAVALAPGIYQPGLMCYVASMFRNWKGSMNYYVDVDKNNYYSGRLGLAFVSGYKTSEVTGATNFDACYKLIVDLTEKSSAEFKIGYQSASPWLSVDISNASESADQDHNSSLGCFVIYVDNKLSAQSNVPLTVPINVWNYGGDDLSFAIPDFGSYGPYIPLDPEPLIAHVGNDDEPVPGLNTQTQTTPPKTNMLNSECAGTRFEGEMYCMGESVSSLRTLTRRFGVSGQGNGLEWKLDTNYFSDRSAGIIVNRASNVPLYYISYIYRFFSGSRKYKFAVLDANNDVTLPREVAYLKAWMGFEYISDPFGASTSLTLDGNGTFRSEVSTQFNNMLEIAIPYYRSRLLTLVSSVNVQTEDFRPVVNFEVVTKTTATTDDPPQIRFFTAAGDDFSFGYLVGAPTITRLDGQ